MHYDVAHIGGMNDTLNPKLENSPVKRIPRTARVSLKLTEQEKRALDQMAWDRDDSVSRIIRIALTKQFPQIFQR